VDHGGVDIEGRRLHRPAALQIEDEFGVGLGQPEQRRRLAGDRRLAFLQQRQILGMELRQKIPRGLRRRQLVPQQQRQRLVLTELVEIFRPLAPPAAHIANRLSTTAEALSPRRRLYSLTSRSMTAAVPVGETPRSAPAPRQGP